MAKSRAQDVLEQLESQVGEANDERERRIARAVHIERTLADPVLPRRKERLAGVVDGLTRNREGEQAEISRLTAAIDERIARLWASPVSQDAVDVLIEHVGKKPLSEAAVERLLVGSPRLGLLASLLEAGAEAYAAHYREIRALKRRHAVERRPLRQEAARLRKAIRRAVTKSTQLRAELRAMRLTLGERAEANARLGNVTVEAAMVPVKVKVDTARLVNAGDRVQQILAEKGIRVSDSEIVVTQAKNGMPIVTAQVPVKGKVQAWTIQVAGHWEEWLAQRAARLQ